MPTKRACAECHRAKCKCVFSQEIQSKCDRCVRLSRECVPHLSRQGQREKKGEGGHVADGVTFPSTMSGFPVEGGNAGASGNELIRMISGSYLHGQRNLFTQSDASQLQIPTHSHAVPSSPMLHQNDNPLVSLHLDRIGGMNLGESRTLNPAALASITLEPSFIATQQHQTTTTTHQTIKNMTNTTPRADTVINFPPSATSLPLRQWIDSARDFDENNLISPRYLTSCLQIAVSLSKEISDAEDFLCDKLRSMPINITNWAEFVTVKLKENEAGNFSANDQPSTAETFHDELALLEAWFDKVCEEEQNATSSSEKSFFYNIDSAEIFTHDTTLDGNHIEFLSPEKKRQRIYALGLVFYELFSGGRSPPPEFLPFSFNDPKMTPSCRGTNLIHLDVNKLDDDDKVRRNDRDRTKLLSDPQVHLHSGIESLKAIGISYRLCDLLYNMLDCINGDMSEGDAYVKLSDVTSDLQQMIDKPLKFLHDPDVTTISSMGLQLKDMTILRDSEFASLQQAYHRSTEGSPDFALITGGSGTGKSFLAFRLGRYITDCGGIFLSVKFDPVAQAKPFSALVSAFNEYCNLFKAMKDSNWVKALASKLRNDLGQDVNHLIKIIPNLSDIISHETSDNTLDEGCVNGLKKIHYLLTHFVEVISACSKLTVSLLLDDLQWADAFSLSVLEEIFKMPEGDKRFFFIGCCRDDDMNNDHPFQKVLDRSSAYGIRLTMVHLECIDKDSVNTMISELLCLPSRLVNGLADILYSKTKGNELFLSRLLVSLNRDGLLNFSLRRRRWVWDEEQIQSRELPEDVASFFSNSIRALSPQVQTALQVLSCFGSAEVCILSMLESNLSLELVNPLELAVDEGFVSKKDHQYRFAHDKILQAAYEMTELEDRRLQHLQYGISLVRALETENATNILLTAIGQINLAGPSVVTNPTLSTEFAVHNLTAGKTAMAMSEYTAAALYAQNGIAFLKKVDHWRAHYRLSLELFELATKCMLVLGDFDNLTTLSDQVFENAHSLEDKLDTLFTVMTSLTYSSKMSDSINMGISILFQLGFELPTTFTLEDTVTLVQQTLTELSIPDHVLLTYKKMSDRRHLMAMKCLAKMELTTSMANPFLQPIVTLKIVRLTVDHGLSFLSPVGFAYFAGLLLKHGEMQAGFRFAQLAMKMLEQVGSKEVAGEVIFNATQVLCFHLPLASINEHRLRGQDAALAAGDVPFACGLKLSYCVTLFWAGSNLITTKNIYAQAGRYMKGQKNLTSYNLLMLSYNGLLALLGETDKKKQLTEAQLTNPLQKLTFYFQNMFLSYVLNMYDDMKQYAENFFDFRQTFECKMSIWYAMHEFYGGLVSYRIYRESGDVQWLDRGNYCKSVVQLWAEQGSLWNFEQKQHLLEAEEQYCQENFLAAQKSYERAISLARSHKFINDEALANELAGYFYQKLGISTTSLEHLTCAHKNYIEWGASVKCNKIFEFIKDTLGSNSLSAGAMYKENIIPADQDSGKRRIT